jgi:hypothetical protein
MYTKVEKKNFVKNLWIVWKRTNWNLMVMIKRMTTVEKSKYDYIQE